MNSAKCSPRKRRRSSISFANCSAPLSTEPQKSATCTFRNRTFQAWPHFTPDDSNAEVFPPSWQSGWRGKDYLQKSLGGIPFTVQRGRYSPRVPAKSIEVRAARQERGRTLEKLPGKDLRRRAERRVVRKESVSRLENAGSCAQSREQGHDSAEEKSLPATTTNVNQKRSKTSLKTSRRGKGYGRHRPSVLGSAGVLIKGNRKNVLDYLDALRRGEEDMTIEQFDEATSTLSRFRRLQDALALIDVWECKPLATKLIQAKSVKSYTIMIDVYGKSLQLTRAFSLFYGMPRLGVQPNTVTFNTMISACARSSEPDLAYGVFEEMQACGMEADKYTYGALIDSFAKSGEVDKAFQISAMMDKAGVHKDQTVYSALMDACGKAKQSERAFILFEEMKRHEVWPNLITFSVLIDTCANAREPEKAFYLFSEMKHWGLPRANVVVYTALIDACSKAGWPERAEIVLESMIENGVQPNEVSFGALIDGWMKEGNVERGFGILDRMVTNHNVMPNGVVIGGLIDACKKRDQTFHAKRIWNIITNLNILPSRSYYPALMTMAAHNGDIDVASAIALHAYARGSLRRVALNSESPQLHALACAIAYLHHAILSSKESPAVKKQLLGRLKVVFNSTAMPPSQMNGISTEGAYKCAMNLNVPETKQAPSGRGRKFTVRQKSGQARRLPIKSFESETRTNATRIIQGLSSEHHVKDT